MVNKFIHVIKTIVVKTVLSNPPEWTKLVESGSEHLISDIHTNIFTNSIEKYFINRVVLAHYSDNRGVG